MGGDWDATLELFVDAYPGLQATAVNGDEGQAYTDVLLDALQADDDDADLMNGTLTQQKSLKASTFMVLHSLVMLNLTTWLKSLLMLKQTLKLKLR